MSSDQDPSSSAIVSNPGPFVVPHPCPACKGDALPHACSLCKGTGVQRFFHGTKADLKIGDLISAGRAANFGNLGRATTFVYLTGTFDAAAWGAELARGEGRGRIYFVEPTGAIENDPNLTDKKFSGNPTKSYRSSDPLRVVGEVVNWQGHSEEQLQTMRDALARLAVQGVEPID
jgi:rifampin ADP-ribosylating transferase